MRRVVRPALPVRAQAYLNNRQSIANQRRAVGTLDIERDWKAARQTRAIASVLRTLQQMMGVRERCMYCVDSHGCDIEHFRPKARYQARAFRWSNMLLCCTECGRFKGSQFPMANRRSMLIDPTAEDPWHYLDFDPDTGNLTARFDPHTNDWSPKGATTVAVLRLDRREAMAAGYLTTYRRLTDVLRASLASLANGSLTASMLCTALRDADDHGLLPWCFDGAGQTFSPFSELHQQYPKVWADCVSTML
jgi:uncharacterized protein (TIGR02646 family)